MSRSRIQSLFDPLSPSCPFLFPNLLEPHSCCPGSPKSPRGQPLATLLPSTTSPTATRLISTSISLTPTTTSRPTSTKVRLTPWDSIDSSSSSFPSEHLRWRGWEGAFNNLVTSFKVFKYRPIQQSPVSAAHQPFWIFIALLIKIGWIFPPQGRGWCRW